MPNDHANPLGWDAIKGLIRDWRFLLGVLVIGSIGGGYVISGLDGRIEGLNDRIEGLKDVIQSLRTDLESRTDDLEACVDVSETCKAQREAAGRSEEDWRRKAAAAQDELTRTTRRFADELRSIEADKDVWRKGVTLVVDKVLVDVEWSLRRLRISPDEERARDELLETVQELRQNLNGWITSEVKSRE